LNRIDIFTAKEEVFSMKSIKLLLAIVLLVICIPLLAQDVEKAAGTITAETYFKHVEFLGDKKLEGRLPGSEGAKKAGDYIAEKLKKYGVEPKGDDETYFQKATWKHRDKEYKCRNIIGIIPGSDEKLKDEVIIVLAHFDHVGKGEYGVKKEYHGKVCPGANDNASGSGGLLEIARAITEGKLKLKRSVLLLAVTGEEAGCRGSKHYVSHPLVPLEKTQAVINLDQIGGYETAVAAMGVHMSPQFDEALDEALKGEDLKISRQKIQGRGDNVSFNSRYIPSLFFWTGFGDHYHQPTDTTDNINKKMGAVICRVALKVVTYLANAEKIESKLEKKRGEKKPYLGVSTDSAEGGVKITGVGEGSPADKGGLKKDDVIIEFAGKEVTSYNKFIKLLNKHNPFSYLASTTRYG
jgi:hypothetical protein